MPRRNPKFNPGKGTKFNPSGSEKSLVKRINTNMKKFATKRSRKVKI